MRHLQNMVFIVYKSTKQRDKGKKKVRLISGQRDTHRLTQTLKSLNPKSLNPSGGRKEDLDNNIPFSSIWRDLCNDMCGIQNEWMNLGEGKNKEWNEEEEEEEDYFRV